MLLLLLYAVALTLAGPVQDFTRAMQRRAQLPALALRSAMNATLVQEHRLRLGLPAGQQLRWQLQHDAAALGQLHRLALQYMREADSIMRGFVGGAKKVLEHCTNQRVALYHLRELVQQSEHLSATEKRVLHEQIVQAGAVEGCPTTSSDELRARLLPVYSEHANKRR